MKRLFCVKHTHNPKAVKAVGIDCFFDNKPEAKQARDSVGGVDAGFYVSRGPDHIGKHGQGKVPYMRRQPRGSK